MDQHNVERKAIAKMLNDHLADVRGLIQAFRAERREAMAAFTVALAHVVDRERLGAALRAQAASFDTDARPEDETGLLLEACWRSIQEPATPRVR